jgi:ribosomal protein L11 methylase PrmA
VERNGVDTRVRWLREWVDARGLALLGPREGVVANLETGALRTLLPGLASVLADRGWLILSGITREEWVPMRRATEGVGFRLDSVDRDGEWCSGLFRVTRRSHDPLAGPHGR